MKHRLIVVSLTAFLLVLIAGCSSTRSVTKASKSSAAPPRTMSAVAPAPAGEVVSAPMAVTPELVAPSTNALVLWNFESKTTDGWSGKEKWAGADTVNEDPAFVKDGKYSLRINAKGSNGWNQDIAVNDGPFPSELTKLKAITMDIYAPKESMEGLPYVQVFLVISSSANGWYQVQQELKPGWNSLEFNINPEDVNGEIWQVYLVLNSSQELNGPIYVDNVIGKF